MLGNKISSQALSELRACHLKLKYRHGELVAQGYRWQMIDDAGVLLRPGFLMLGDFSFTQNNLPMYAFYSYHKNTQENEAQLIRADIDGYIHGLPIDMSEVPQVWNNNAYIRIFIYEKIGCNTIYLVQSFSQENNYMYRCLHELENNGTGWLPHCSPRPIPVT